MLLLSSSGKARPSATRFRSKIDTTTTHTFSRPTLHRIQQRWLSSNLRGQVPARKQGQRRSGHSVRRCSLNLDNLIFR